MRRFCAISLLIVTCSWRTAAMLAAAPQDPPPSPPPQIDTPAPTDAPRPTFAEWLAGVRTEAIMRGIRPAVVDEALATVTEPEPTVIERDRSQAETVLALEQYISRRLTAKVLASGREMMARHREVLGQVGERYGVPPKIIVGIWGLESNFGRFSGVRPTIGALATLAWDARRGTFFRGELMAALEILDQGDIDLDHLRGSWAGAMGQTQFIPSSYLKWAQDFDGDGRRDIWSSPPDVFASIANYLKEHGWMANESWGREVKVSPTVAERIAGEVAQRTGSCQARRNMSEALPMSTWQALGVRALNGRALPRTDIEASLVSGSTRHFLVYRNYDALLEYNCAHSYAISVALLADRVDGTGPPPARKAAPRRTARAKRAAGRTD